MRAFTVPAEKFLFLWNERSDINEIGQHSRQIFSFVRSSQGALTHIAFSARIDQSDAVISLLPRFAAIFRIFWKPPIKKHCTLE